MLVHAMLVWFTRIDEGCPCGLRLEIVARTCGEAEQFESEAARGAESALGMTSPDAIRYPLGLSAIDVPVSKSA